jgi:hypothetical protein
VAAALLVREQLPGQFHHEGLLPAGEMRCHAELAHGLHALALLAQVPLAQDAALA